MNAATTMPVAIASQAAISIIKFIPFISQKEVPPFQVGEHGQRWNLAVFRRANATKRIRK
jgi:hypothetical protein